MVFQKWMHTLVTQVLRNSNEWYSTHISRIFGFHSRLKYYIRRLNAVTEAWTLSTLVKPTIFAINVGAVVQNVGFPGCFKVILTG